MTSDIPAPAMMGMTPEIFLRLSREYARLNPHNLPELRRPVRTRPLRRRTGAVLVASTRHNKQFDAA